jgi:hypothetical protein
LACSNSFDQYAAVSAALLESLNRDQGQESENAGSHSHC